jgi:ketosteroid isomerase-like protein
MKSIVFLLVLIALFSCKNESKMKVDTNTYIPVDQKLFDEILQMDKVFFDAYNNCDLDKQAEIYADDVEFFHDQGGFMNSKVELIEGTKEYICGKVQRELVKESVEVYPIKDYGAVQIGMHKFHNNQEPDAESVPSKFIVTWEKQEQGWKMAKVISLH